MQLNSKSPDKFVNEINKPILKSVWKCEGSRIIIKMLKL